MQVVVYFKRNKSGINKSCTECGHSVFEGFSVRMADFPAVSTRAMVAQKQWSALGFSLNKHAHFCLFVCFKNLSRYLCHSQTVDQASFRHLCNHSPFAVYFPHSLEILRDHCSDVLWKSRKHIRSAFKKQRQSFSSLEDLEEQHWVPRPAYFPTKSGDNA